MLAAAVVEEYHATGDHGKQEIPTSVIDQGSHTLRVLRSSSPAVFPLLISGPLEQIFNKEG